METIDKDRLDLSARLAVAQVDGADARRFLQAQFSCDVARLGDSHACYGAYLSIQGRVLTTAYVVPAGEHFYLLLHPDLIAGVIARLAKYVLRDDVHFRSMPDKAVFGSGCPTPAAGPPDLSLLPVTAAPEGCQVQLPDGRRMTIAAAGDATASDRWWRADLRVGIAGIEQATSDQHLPQALGLERIKAVSFAKGCYPGQEIVARVHYRGRVKRGLRLLRGAAGMAAGDELLDPEGGRCGQVIACAAEDDGGQLILAVVGEDVQIVNGAGGEPLAPIETF